MKIILFAGGTGKRFWPASRRKSPKQFLPIAGDKPLLRQRVDLLLEGFETEDIFISTGERYEAEVKQMLPDIPEENLILEPEMRDTGPAVALAMAHVNHKFPNEIVSIQWSDHLIKKPQEFIDALKLGADRASDTGKAIFITVPARFPSPHRGYIKFGADLGNGLREFVQFVEKPDVATAEGYIASRQYGWNPGYWMLPPKMFFAKMQQHQPHITQVTKEIVESDFAPESLAKFAGLEKRSADYLFAEKVESSEAEVLLVDIGWSDVGEWIALKEALVAEELDNLLEGNVFDLESKDTLVYNYQEGKLVATLGLEGVVVVNTSDVVMVFRKEDNAKLKQFLTELEAQTGDKYL